MQRAAVLVKGELGAAGGWCFVFWTVCYLGISGGEELAQLPLHKKRYGGNVQTRAESGKLEGDRQPVFSGHLFPTPRPAPASSVRSQPIRFLWCVLGSALKVVGASAAPAPPHLGLPTGHCPLWVVVSLAEESDGQASPGVGTGGGEPCRRVRITEDGGHDPEAPFQLGDSWLGAFESAELRTLHSHMSDLTACQASRSAVGQSRPLDLLARVWLRSEQMSSPLGPTRQGEEYTWVF